MAAPIEYGEEKGVSIPTTPETAVQTIEPEMQVFDLYAVGHDLEHTIQPFIHRLNICSKGGEVIRVWANFDDGALANAMSITKFNAVKHRLGHYKPSTRWLRMADGTAVRPVAMWEGKLEIEGIEVQGSFEVFDSGGNWEFLFGKPLLTAFQATHDYTLDTVTIKNKNLSTTLHNQTRKTAVTEDNTDLMEIGGHEAQSNLGGSQRVLPLREVPTKPCTIQKPLTDVAYIETPNAEHISINQNNPNIQNNDIPPGRVEIDVKALKNESNIYTRLTEPWKKERVDEILRQVTIGPDLSDEERHRVLEFLSEWADIFALSVNEVKPVENAVHRLDIPTGTKFSTKVHQKPLTPPQRKHLYESVDKMLEAGIIEQCSPDQVKCASPTTLAQKVHTGTGLTLEELQHQVNDECIAHGFEPAFDLPPRSTPTPDDESEKGEPKWRICQNFSQINKMTKIAPMPQGDIRAKQQRLSGHR